MSKRGDYASTSWQDVEKVVQDWSREYKCSTVVELHFQPNLSSGAYVEVVLYDGYVPSPNRELVRVRQPFPIRKLSGHPGAVVHAVFLAFQELDNNPWLWPAERRKQVTE